MIGIGGYVICNLHQRLVLLGDDLYFFITSSLAADLTDHLSFSFSYNIVFFITTYLLPMVVMLVCYYLIGRELWGSRSIGELTDRQVTSIRSKRRVSIP